MSLRRRRRHSFHGDGIETRSTAVDDSHALPHTLSANGLNECPVRPHSRAGGAGATSSTPSATPSLATACVEGKGERKAATTPWVCHICLDDVSSPVVTPCGHLFCWEHLHEWFTVASGVGRTQCPVCKAPASTSTVIPIYSVDGQDKDPRHKPIPPRPRPIAPSTTDANAFSSSSSSSSLSSFHNFSFEAGIFGALPGLSMSWNWSNDAGSVQGLQGGRRGGPHGAGVLLEESFFRDVFSRVRQIFIVLFFAFFVAMTFSS
ncbi:BQ2448_882 [Microbotryum intermedium]|uniref:RING-type E3 ubiquitin transferase n=1 Tax=Microbotryum intermedium TaxID=269621 RepID=A0A238F9H3_9BASI|nr:BQ2448_882 [Microbotryum intermedium]